jgi:hypothetical protein
MIETSVFTKEFLFIKNLVSLKKFGDIQYVKGEHIQNMGG